MDLPEFAIQLSPEVRVRSAADLPNSISAPRPRQVACFSALIVASEATLCDVRSLRANGGDIVQNDWLTKARASARRTFLGTTVSNTSAPKYSRAGGNLSRQV
jgi:hypothetical protein